MSRHRWTVAAIGAWCGTLAVFGTLGGLSNGHPLWSQLAMGVIVSAVGVVLIARVPQNRVSWLVMLVGLVWSWMYAGNAWTLAEWRSVVPEGGVILFVWLGHWIWIIGMVPLIYALIRFPDGELLSPRWRVAWWIGTIGTSSLIVGSMLGPFQQDARFFDPRHRVLFERGDFTISNPLEIQNSDILLLVGLLFVMAFAFAAVVSLFVRYRRSGRLERAQLRWVAFAGVISILAYALGDQLERLPVIDWEMITLVFITAVPMSIGVAITRYHLYDIDTVIRRTVAYTIVVGALAAIFAVCAIWLPQLLPTADNNLAIAASTLAIAALFNPLRSFVQRSIDRHFNRSRYDADIVASRLASEVRNALAAKPIGEAFGRAASRTLEPTTAGVWLKDPS